MIIYETTVSRIGDQATGFIDFEMIILFGEIVPAELEDFCYIVKVTPVIAEIKAGMKLQIDENQYEITAVGHEVQNNLSKLGHISISFTGSTLAELPGSLYVEKKELPQLGVGSSIVIEG